MSSTWYPDSRRSSLCVWLCSLISVLALTIHLRVALFSGSLCGCSTCRDCLHLCALTSAIPCHFLRWAASSPQSLSSTWFTALFPLCVALLIDISARLDSIHLRVALFSGSHCGCSTCRDCLHLCALTSAIPCLLAVGCFIVTVFVKHMVPRFLAPP